MPKNIAKAQIFNDFKELLPELLVLMFIIKFPTEL